MADISVIKLPNGNSYNLKDTTARSTADSAVPNTRTVNGKALSSNISLGAGDVGAYTKGETDTKINAAVASTYKYKGSVTADKLPTSGQVVGDVYNITNDSSYGKAGMNVAWNGTTWDALGSNVDLSNYVTTSDSRLSNARPASDVYAWAKAAKKPSYSASEIGAAPASHTHTKDQVGLGNVVNLDQSKAIKSITRSGTTFTATALDGTTSTFTQQDTNTTYGIATASADGLMSKTDKAKLDGIDPSAITTNAANIKKNADAISAETTRAKAAEKANADAISAEVTRAKAAEKANADTISKLNSPENPSLLGSEDDLNNVLTGGFYHIDNGYNPANMPSGNDNAALLVMQGRSHTDIVQILISGNSNNILYRTGNTFNKSWTDWRKIADNSAATESTDGLTILSYGHSSWDDFIAAYNTNTIVYCRASSDSNPASGSQTRMAFMAYVNNETNPTEVEFQYYRSVKAHTASQQGDQVYVYKLNKANGWSVIVRQAYSKIITGTGLTSTYENSAITLKVVNPLPDVTSTDNGKILMVKNGTWGVASDTINDHIANKSNPHGVTKAQVGLGSVANLDQSKAIKSITRSGTTFTATALDGTTTTFTQQDYPVATTSTDGLMSKTDKAKLDGIASGADISAIKTVKVNGTALTPDNNKAVNIAVPTLANNATTTVSGMALDARMGKTLSDQISSVKAGAIDQIVNLTAAGWTGDAAPYSQAVNVTGMSSELLCELFSACSKSATVAERKAYNKAYAIVASGYAETADGKVTFYTDKKPAIDIGVRIKSISKANAVSDQTSSDISNAVDAMSNTLEERVNSLNLSLAKLYPVGSIYISVNDTDPGTFIGGTWELVGSGKTLWGADSTHAAGTTIDAGLPNMTGWLQFSAGGYGADNSKLGGAFYADGYYGDGTNGYAGGSGNGTLYQGLHIDASRSNAIYGNSSTVQPPAYVVYMWKRTA